MRKEIVDTLLGITPFDAEEKESIAFAVKWIDSGAELFRIVKPATPSTHLVAYCLLLNGERSRMLLGQHKESGLWLPPGGHVDNHEYPREAAIRELKEELRVQADLFSLDPFFLTITKISEISAHTDVGFWYLSKGNEEDCFWFDSQEFEEVKWFDLQDVLSLKTDRHMKRFIAKLVWDRILPSA
jgi:8-oxo-dGTP diphosphatase